MKKLIVFVLFFCVCAFSYAQTDVQQAANEAAKAISNAPKSVVKNPRSLYWTNSVLTKLDFGQMNLTNWAKGGYNTLSMTSNVDAKANYAKAKTVFTNRLQLNYGFFYSEDKPLIQKSDDRIYFESRWGYKAGKVLNYSASFSFKSQFSNSYKYSVPTSDGTSDPTRQDWLDARLLKSGFLSPAYTDLGFGMDWVPNKWLSVNLAPITGGFVIVKDKTLRPSYSMSLRKLNEEEQAEYDEAAAATYANAIEKGEAIGQFYKSAKFEFGAKLTTDFKFKVNDNFNYAGQLVLFSDYLDNPQNLRVNWDNQFDWKLAKYFSMSITTNLIYDDNVYIIRDKDSDRYPNGRRRIQFKESLAFGFSYTIASKK
ncbi:MAG: DUF3078 domain-containing protein [Bacteroidales bacterium]|jgi:hypothetical protein|nr:DUF3078 domain-containing protein [Bacteroidales bacterium]MCI1785150.1 DUF3078 domain-containing protein [Bacteroidales bacterium]